MTDSTRTNVTTHILDTSLGKPAAGVTVWLEKITGHDSIFINKSVTDTDGRVGKLTPEGIESGHYRLYADIGAYFASSHRETLYPLAIIDVMLCAEQSHYHLPLLITPYSWSTYRGS